MATIIISIHKQYCDALFAGEKVLEFRKTVPSRPVTNILVYEAKGCGKVVGELKVKDTLVGTPEEIWNQTKDKGGIEKEAFFTYFKDKKKAVAFVIESTLKYDEAIPLSHYGLSHPPQNYIWIEK